MEKCYEVLIKSFERTQYIDFETVMFGWSESVKLCLLNEYDYDLSLEINCKASTVGLFHNGNSVKSKSVIISQFDRIELTVVWKPETVGNMAETIDFKARGLRVQTKLVGCCVEAKKKKPRNNKENMRPKQPKTAETAKIDTMTNVETDKKMSQNNEYISELWLQNQETVYKKFLNSTFSMYSNRFGKEEMISNISKYREYFDACQKSCLSLFERFDRQIQKDTFIMKDEVFFRRNTTYHNRLIRIVFSYNPIWLFFGLEVIMNQKLDTLMLDGANENRLRQFVITKFLWSDEINKNYNLKVDKMLRIVEFEKKLSRYIMKNVFKLVFLLDRAKSDNLIPKEVSLFKAHTLCSDTGSLSSEYLLQNFADSLLKNESNLVKKLTSTEPKLMYTENALATMDFSVTNLAKDLADGLRLVKLASILTNDENLLSQIRYPPADNIRKQHNISLAMNAFRDTGGVNLVTFSGLKQIDVESICNGHREKTLALLWCIVARYYVTELINKARLVDEVKKLRQLVVFGDTEKTKVTRKVLGEINTEDIGNKVHSQQAEVGLEDLNNVQLLVTWVKLVNSLYFRSINENTASGTLDESQLDGRSMCILVHYYLPHLIRLKYIMHNKDEKDDSVWIPVFQEKMKCVGGMPVISLDSKHSLLSTLAFLSNRIFELSQQSWAVVVIQRCYRFHREVSQYKHFESQIINIQAWYRQILAVKLYRTKLRFVIMLQAVSRRYLAMDRCKRIKQSVVTIQKNYRSYLARKLYRKMRESAVKIQQNVRMYQHVRRYKALKQAILNIQKNVRMYQGKKRFDYVKRSVLVIQKNVRMWVEQRKYHNLKKCTVIIQKNMKMCRDRGRYILMKQAAVVIQTSFRRYIARQKFVVVKNGFILLQALWKQKRTRQKYLQLQQATITLQKYTRQYLVRKNYLETRQKIITIQKVWRGLRARKLFILKRASVIIIQKNFRKIVQRNKYLTFKQDIIFVQSYIRGWLQRRQLANKICATKVIQSNVRKWLCQKRYRELKQSTIILQSYVRMWSVRKEYITQRSAAIILQSYIRGYSVRKSIKKAHNAAKIIQKNYRSYKYRHNYQNLQKATLMIQKHIRGYQARQNYKFTYNTVVLLQSLVRKMNARKKYVDMRQSAITIQKYWRGFQCKRRYELKKKSSLLIQTNFRKYLCEEKYRRIKSSVVIIQKNWKMYSARKQFNQQKTAANTIRKYVLRKVARTRYLKLKQASIMLQANYRRHKARSRYLALKHACVSMQAQVRMRQARNLYCKMLIGFCKLQTLVRMRRDRKQFVAARTAAVCIQSHVRRWRAVRYYKETLAGIITIQKSVRGYQARQKFLQIKTATVCIQKNVRAYLQKRRYIKMKNSTVTLQRYMRGYIAHKHYQAAKASAIILQKHYRRFKAVQHYQQKRQTVIKLQASVRGYQARKNFAENRANMIMKRAEMLRQIELEKLRMKLVRLQIIFRVSQFHVLLVRARRRINAVGLLQRMWRGTLVRKFAHADKPYFSKRLSNMRSRVHVALCNFSQSRTMSFIGTEALQKLQSVINSAGVPRSPLIRGSANKMDENDPVASVLFVRPDPSKKPPSTTNNNTFVNVAAFVAPLLDLEKVTRLSKEMCEMMYHSNMFDQLIRIIRFCNRGEADLEVVSVAISILINLGRARIISLLGVAENNVETNNNPPEIVRFCVDQLKRHVAGRPGSKAITVFCRAGLLLVLLNQAQEQAVKTCEHKNIYRLSQDTKFGEFVTETREHLRRQWFNSSQHSKLNANKLVEEMKLSPYWDLSRSSYPDINIIGITSCTKTSSSSCIPTAIKSRSVGRIKPPLPSLPPTFKKPSSTISKSSQSVQSLRLSSTSSIKSGYGVLKQTNNLRSSKLTGSNSSLAYKSDTCSLASSLSDLPKSVCSSGPSYSGKISSMAKRKVHTITKIAATSNDAGVDTKQKSLPSTWDLIHKYYVISLLFVELFDLGKKKTK